MNFTTSPREAFGQVKWNEFVEKSDEAWLWHLAEYREPDDFMVNKTDLSFVVLDNNGQPALVLPLLLTQSRVARVIPFKVLTSLGGPAAINGLSPKSKVKLYEFLREQLSELVARHGVARLDICVPPMAPAFRGERCPRVNPLLFLGCENTQTQTWVVDLHPPEEQLRRAYAEGTREELRKIQRETYEVRPAVGADLDIYYELHRITYLRSGKAPYPFTYYKHIFDHFVSKGLCRIVFFVQNGEALATHNALHYKNAALYWTAASKLGKPGGANRLLMDEQIMFAKQHGIEWFESGEAFPQLAGGKYKGISDYKTSFGSVLYPFYKGCVITRSKLHAAVDFLRALRG